MARAGLGLGWHCAFANDIDPMKGRVYAQNWGHAELCLADINTLQSNDLPSVADLIWASFPCQDLSLAGNSVGLGTEAQQTRSGAFWALWRLIESLRIEDRAPKLVVLENVYGILTANGGRDFAAIGRCLSLSGYRFGAILLDGALFVPQSRPRIFIVAVRSNLAIPEHLLSKTAQDQWHPEAMRSAILRLGEPDLEQWFWLSPPPVSINRPQLADLIDDSPSGVVWHSASETAQLIAMMSQTNHSKLKAMLSSSGREVATLYKRTRRNEHGNKIQRAELRTDGIAGCLRTPGGGSSRQYVVVTSEGGVRTRLLSPREAARLMGLPDTYELPARYNDAYHVAGDGLVVPAVSYLARSVLEPILYFNAAQGISIAAE